MDLQHPKNVSRYFSPSAHLSVIQVVRRPAASQAMSSRSIQKFRAALWSLLHIGYASDSLISLKPSSRGMDLQRPKKFSISFSPSAQLLVMQVVSHPAASQAVSSTSFQKL